MAIFGTSIVVGLSLGCSSTSKVTAEKDPRLARYVDEGQEAFAEGEIDTAFKEYRRALLRAWATDDPYESGTAAYHFAAVLLSLHRYEESSNWLIDSRVEFVRANVSTGNAWLLSAEIAMAQERFEEAQYCLNRASQECYPCTDHEIALSKAESLRREEAACRTSCLHKIPCLGERLRKKQEAKECQSLYRISLELAQARLNAKQLDPCNARKHLQKAASLSNQVCDLSIQADRLDAAALISDMEANHLQAGSYRDCEIEILRSIGHYREIPNILDAAGESYCQAESCERAVDRWIRSARIYLARGEYERCWERIQAASELATRFESESTGVRLALTARLLEESIGSKGLPTRSSNVPPVDKTSEPSTSAD